MLPALLTPGKRIDGSSTCQQGLGQRFLTSAVPISQAIVVSPTTVGH